MSLPLHRIQNLSVSFLLLEEIEYPFEGIRFSFCKVSTKEGIRAVKAYCANIVSCENSIPCQKKDRHLSPKHFSQNKGYNLYQVVSLFLHVKAKNFILLFFGYKIFPYPFCCWNKYPFEGKSYDTYPFVF